MLSLRRVVWRRASTGACDARHTRARNCDVQPPGERGARPPEDNQRLRVVGRAMRSFETRAARHARGGPFGRVPRPARRGAGGGRQRRHCTSVKTKRCAPARRTVRPERVRQRRHWQRRHADVGGQRPLEGEELRRHAGERSQHRLGDLRFEWTFMILHELVLFQRLQRSPPRSAATKRARESCHTSVCSCAIPC